MLTVALWVALLPGQPANDTGPKEPPPAIVVARLHEKGDLLVEQFRYNIVTKTMELKEKVGERVVTKTVQYQEYVPVKVMTMLRLKGATITDAGGSKVDAKKLAKLLAKPTAVLISYTGKAVDPLYLKAFKKDTLVFVFKPSPVPVKRTEPKEGKEDKEGKEGKD